MLSFTEEPHYSKLNSSSHPSSDAFLTGRPEANVCLQEEIQTVDGTQLRANRRQMAVLKTIKPTPVASRRGAPLGLLVGVPYTDTTFALGAGDCLALFSDGVTEAKSEAGEDFGEARLCDIVRSSAGESADVVVARIFEAIDRFAGRAPQFDDITVLVLKKLDIPEK